MKNARTGESQTLRTATALTDSSTGTAATASSLLTNLGASVGDKLTFSGTRTDGSSVSVDVDVDGSTTMQDVLDALSANGTGFGVAGHGANASIDAQGRIQIADSAVGDSKLSFTATNDRAGGGTLDFGTTNVATAGRAMQLAAPSDAQVRIDGVLVSRSTNTISDALAGVTLSLQHAEVGTTVERQRRARYRFGRQCAQVAGDGVQCRVELRQQADGGERRTAVRQLDPQHDERISRTVCSAASLVLSNATYTTASMVGLSLDKNGVLTVDADALKTALAAKPNEVKALFQTTGIVVARVGAVHVGVGEHQARHVQRCDHRGGDHARRVEQRVHSTYGNAATANQMVVTDSFSGNATTVSLADSDTHGVDREQAEYGVRREQPQAVGVDRQRRGEDHRRELRQRLEDLDRLQARRGRRRAAARLRGDDRGHRRRGHDQRQVSDWRGPAAHRRCAERSAIRTMRRVCRSSSRTQCRPTRRSLT